MSENASMARLDTPSPLAVAAPFLRSAPVDLMGMAEALGLTVDMAAALSPDVSGRIVRGGAGSAGYHIDVNAMHSANRKRFTLAHEIAHYLLHRDLIGDGVEDNGLYRSRLSDAIEVEANKFAAQILMPSQLVREVYRLVKSLPGLTAAFQVSEDAMRIRLKELRLTP